MTKRVHLLYPHCVNFAHRSTPTNVNLIHQRRGMEEQCMPDLNSSVSATTHNKTYIHSFSQWLILLSPTILTFSSKSPCIVLWLKMHAALCFISTSPWDFMALYLMKYRVTFIFYLHIMVYAVFILKYFVKELKQWYGAHHNLWNIHRYILLTHITNRQVTGSIPDGIIGSFQWHNPSSRTMALGSTQPPTEMSTRCISCG